MSHSTKPAWWRTQYVPKTIYECRSCCAPAPAPVCSLKAAGQRFSKKRWFCDCGRKQSLSGYQLCDEPTWVCHLGHKAHPVPQAACAAAYVSGQGVGSPVGRCWHPDCGGAWGYLPGEKPARARLGFEYELENTSPQPAAKRAKRADSLSSSDSSSDSDSSSSDSDSSDSSDDPFCVPVPPGTQRKRTYAFTVHDEWIAPVATPKKNKMDWRRQQREFRDFMETRHGDEAAEARLASRGIIGRYAKANRADWTDYITKLVDEGWQLQRQPRLPELLRLKKESSWTSLGGLSAKAFKKALWARQDNECARCERKLQTLENDEELEYHHWAHRAAPDGPPNPCGKGPQCGPNELWNVEGLCHRCHRKLHRNER